MEAVNLSRLKKGCNKHKGRRTLLQTILQSINKYKVYFKSATVVRRVSQSMKELGIVFKKVLQLLLQLLFIVHYISCLCEYSSF